MPLMVWAKGLFWGLSIAVERVVGAGEGIPGKGHRWIRTRYGLHRSDKAGSSRGTIKVPRGFGVERHSPCKHLDDFKGPCRLHVPAALGPCINQADSSKSLRYMAEFKDEGIRHDTRAEHGTCHDKPGPPFQSLCPNADTDNRHIHPQWSSSLGSSIFTLRIHPPLPSQAMTIRGSRLR